MRCSSKMPSNSAPVQRRAPSLAPNSEPKAVFVVYIKSYVRHSQTVRVAELIDQALRSLSLFHDSLFVILTDRTAQFVVVHGRPVLASAPESGHANRVLDFEDALCSVHPSDATAVELRLAEQLLEELPQVNVGAGAAAAARAQGRTWLVRGGAGSGGSGGHVTAVVADVVCKWAIIDFAWVPQFN